MDPIRYAVIGLGFFGEKHAEVLSDMSGAELIVVCTRRPHRGKEIAERFGVPKTYTDYRDLLAADEVDAVSIVSEGMATPHVEKISWAGSDVLGQRAFTRALAHWLDDAAEVHMNCLDHALKGFDAIMGGL